MLESVELNFHPSCSNALAWSADGELAIAAGEYVHILTPKITATRGETARQQPPTGEQWHTTRFKANVFANHEWPYMRPLPREVFSIGEEQSLSNVVALSWSPPGLAKHSRCSLAVLTSNLVLSIWEAVDGQAKWTRVCVVNKALKNYFSPLLGGEGDGSLLKQKQRVRSFSWSPACKPLPSAKHGSSSVEDIYCARWGSAFIAVANDTADLALLGFRRDSSKKNGKLVVEAFQHCGLAPSRPPYPHIRQDSILAASLKNASLVSSMSWGPWYEYASSGQGKEDSECISLLAIVHGPDVKVFPVTARYRNNDSTSPTNLQLGDVDLLSEKNELQNLECKGPLHWIRQAIFPPENNEGRLLLTPKQAETDSIGLCAGLLGGYVIISFDAWGSVMEDTDSIMANITVHHRTLAESMEDQTQQGRNAHWDPVYGITSISSPNKGVSSVYIAGYTSYIRSTQFPVGQETSQSSGDDTIPTQIEQFRKQFDLAQGLRGMSIAKVWGITSYNDWRAAIFTLHPTDMVEYTQLATEYSRLVFNPPLYRGGQGEAGTEMDLPWDVPHISPESTRDSRMRVLGEILDENRERNIGDPWLRKMQYAAACCVIVDNIRDQNLLASARSALQWLADDTALDLSLEISYIDELANEAGEQESRPEGGQAERTRTIPPKDEDQRPEGTASVFEYCEICDSGIEWSSVTESQCAQGHLFVRCGMTFLSIQEPDITKQCSWCKTEMLDEDIVARDERDTDVIMEVMKEEPVENGQHQQQQQQPQQQQQHEMSGVRIPGLINTVSAMFDTCVYCGGKFRS